VNAAEARERFATAPVARLATVGADGRPHLVPITFALLGEDAIVTAVDHKPKRTLALRRLANIAANPQVTLLADHYADDWRALWWARADGRAQVLSANSGPRAMLGVDALVDRYPQYRDRRPSGALILIEVERWSGWSGAG
jgi:PPOX class probable F420-dependent enzyme